jgi:hypothetical protein
MASAQANTRFLRARVSGLSATHSLLLSSACYRSTILNMIMIPRIATLSKLKCTDTQLSGFTGESGEVKNRITRDYVRIYRIQLHASGGELFSNHGTGHRGRSKVTVTSELDLRSDDLIIMHDDENQESLRATYSFASNPSKLFIFQQTRIIHQA